MELNTLIADDHDLIRKTFRTFLEGVEGIRVVGECDNGNDAVRLTGLLSPDLVIMDINMPMLGGIDACEQIKRVNPSTRVVLYSLYKPEPGLKTTKTRADAFIPKDELFVRLPEVVDRFLSQPEKQRPN